MQEGRDCCDKTIFHGEMLHNIREMCTLIVITRTKEKRLDVPTIPFRCRL